MFWKDVNNFTSLIAAVKKSHYVHPLLVMKVILRYFAETARKILLLYILRRVVEVSWHTSCTVAREQAVSRGWQLKLRRKLLRYFHVLTARFGSVVYPCCGRELSSFPAPAPVEINTLSIPGRMWGGRERTKQVLRCKNQTNWRFSSGTLHLPGWSLALHPPSEATESRECQMALMKNKEDSGKEHSMPSQRKQAEDARHDLWDLWYVTEGDLFYLTLLCRCTVPRKTCCY